MSGDGLNGRSVLITRPAGRAEALAEMLRARGAAVELCPTIAFEPPRDPGPAERAVADLRRFDWLVFTSATGVRFFERLRAGPPAAQRPPGRIAAIGPGTARALAGAGLPADLVDEAGDAESLARGLDERGVAGRAVLLVQPETARDVLAERLAAAGARLERVAFYRTVAAPQAATAAERVAAERYDAVVFTSPSTVRCLFEAAGRRAGGLRRGLRRARRVAIGRVTAAELERQGLPADAVAPAPTDASIAAALAALFAD